MHTTGKLLVAAAALLVPIAMSSGQDEAKMPSTRPAVEADRSAERLFAAVQSATDLPQALAAARVFTDAYPADERSAQLFFHLANYAEDDLDRLTHYRKLVDLHPDTSYGQIAAGKLPQLERLGEPFELTFTPVGGGEPIDLQEDYAGKIVVIDFWATWCAPCIAGLPKLEAIQEKYKDQGVEFIGVSLDESEAKGGKAALDAFLAKRPSRWPQYYQGDGVHSEFSASWGIRTLPEMFVVDANGTLRYTDAYGNLEKILPKLIAERDAQVSAR